MPKPWFFGISFSATAGSLTRWRILRATKSEISCVGLAVDQDVAEIAHPDAEAGLAVELFPESLAFLSCHLEGGARIGGMDEAAVGLLAAREDLGIVGPDPAHLLLADLARCATARTIAAVRWNTVRWPTVLATSVMVCTPVAPVPITATRLPAKRTGSFGQ